MGLSRVPVFVKGDYIMVDGKRAYYTDRIAKRLGLDYRAIDGDTGRPWKVIPRCECSHTVLEHRDDANWTCRKCRCKGYSGDDV